MARQQRFRPAASRLLRYPGGHPRNKREHRGIQSRQASHRREARQRNDSSSWEHAEARWCRSLARSVQRTSRKEPPCYRPSAPICCLIPAGILPARGPGRGLPFVRIGPWKRMPIAVAVPVASVIRSRVCALIEEPPPAGAEGGSRGGTDSKYRGAVDCSP